MTYAGWIWVRVLLMINATVEWKWSCAQTPLATRHTENWCVCVLCDVKGRVSCGCGLVGKRREDGRKTRQKNVQKKSHKMSVKRCNFSCSHLAKAQKLLVVSDSQMEKLTSFSVFLSFSWLFPMGVSHYYWIFSINYMLINQITVIDNKYKHWSVSTVEQKAK